MSNVVFNYNTNLFGTVLRDELFTFVMKVGSLHLSELNVAYSGAEKLDRGQKGINI